MNNKKFQKIAKGFVGLVWSCAVIISVVAVIFAVMFASCAKGSSQPPETQAAAQIVSIA